MGKKRGRQLSDAIKLRDEVKAVEKGKGKDVDVKLHSHSSLPERPALPLNDESISPRLRGRGETRESFLYMDDVASSSSSKRPRNEQSQKEAFAAYSAHACKPERQGPNPNSMRAGPSQNLRKSTPAIKGLKNLVPLHPHSARNAIIPQAEREAEARKLYGAPIRGMKQTRMLDMKQSVTLDGSRVVVCRKQEKADESNRHALFWKIRDAIPKDSHEALDMCMKAVIDSGLTSSDEDPLHLPLPDEALEGRRETEELWTETWICIGQVYDEYMSIIDPGFQQELLKHQRGLWVARNCPKGEAELKGEGCRMTTMDGESPSWQYSEHHYPNLFTVITTLGPPCTLHLPTLGYSISIRPGDVVGFIASKLMWKLERAQEKEWRFTPLYVLMTWHENVPEIRIPPSAGKKKEKKNKQEIKPVVVPRPAAQWTSPTSSFDHRHLFNRSVKQDASHPSEHYAIRPSVKSYHSADLKKRNRKASPLPCSESQQTKALHNCRNSEQEYKVEPEQLNQAVEVQMPEIQIQPPSSQIPPDDPLSPMTNSYLSSADPNDRMVRSLPTPSSAAQSELDAEQIDEDLIGDFLVRAGILDGI